MTDSNGAISEIIGGNYLKDYTFINTTKMTYPDVTILELIRKQAQVTPNRIAIEFNGVKSTYQELIEKVNRLAIFLNSNGLQSGDFIAVSLLRGPELVYSLLAIMQCGAAYLPLDPGYPNARLEFMLNDSGAKFLFTSKALNSLPSWTNKLFIEDAVSIINENENFPFNTNVASENIAYLLYTSGSTGNPKGVTITHKNLVNFICSMALEPGIKENDRLLSITTISFDISGLEIYLPLIKGATLILADDDLAKDGRLLLDFLKKENISILQATPTTWQMILDSGWSEALSIKALCGGETLPNDLAKALTEKCDSLWNMYGPTETTIWSAIKKIEANVVLITIGKPIANTQLYIIDEQGIVCAPGNIGEIVIGGDGVSKGGYWKRPELTEEKFIGSDFSNLKEDIFYRTGDLGKLHENNEIECLGRIDQQVKIRGHRIEPGEVEQVLISIEGIKNAVVLANKDFLIAHVVTDSDIKDAEVNIPLWREILVKQLPSHLIPHDFNVIEKLPTTLNGKIDRKALIQYKTTIKDEYTEPRTEEEKIVAAIWKESLKLDSIDIFSNFFEIGGHSINAVRVMSKLEQRTGKKFPLSTLFEHPTIEKIAKLFNTEVGKYSDCIVPLKTNGNKIPLFIIHGAGLNVLNFISMSKYFDDDQPVYGIQGNGPKGYDDWYESIEAMASHYIEAIVKINPTGPYALAGFSFGGIVAFEMTRQLKERGKTVSLTALLDTMVDSSYYYKTYNQKRIVRYINRTRRRFNYLIQMLTSWELLKLRVREKKDFIGKKYFGVNEIMNEQDAFALEQFKEADKMVHGIIDRYQMKPQFIKVDLFRSKEDKSYKTDPMYLGWKKVALNGVTIYNIPGNHLDIVAPPNDKTLARLIQETMDKRHVNS